MKPSLSYPVLFGALLALGQSASLSAADKSAPAAPPMSR